MAVLSQYIFRMVGRPAAEWESKGVAIAGYTLAVIRESAMPSTDTCELTFV